MLNHKNLTNLLLKPLPPVVSFDIFDTLLIRKTDPPERVKEYAAKLAVERGIVDISCENLLSRRHEIETYLRDQARKSGNDSECSVEEIFSLISRELSQGEQVLQGLLEVELAAEQFLIEPMPGMKEVLKSFRGRCRVIAISDTYLPETIISKILVSAGYENCLDQIYCSCDHLLCKGSGRLFTKVLGVEKILPNQLLHIGDNFISDFFVPKSLGLNAFHFICRWNENRREKLKALSLRENKSDFWKGYSFYESISSCEAGDGSQLEILKAWGGEAVAPLLITFIHLLAEKVRKDKVNKLYFIAREGFMLKKIFEHIWNALYTDSPPELIYLCVSRYTSFVASVFSVGPREILLASLGKPLLGDFLRRLGVCDPHDHKSLLEKFGLSLDEKVSDLRTIEKITALTEDSTFINLVGDSCSRMRDDLREYLAQHGFFDNDDFVGFVDVGWIGTIQDSIEQAFRSCPGFPSVKGYYLALDSGVYEEKNDKTGFIYDYRGALPEHMAIRIFREALEFSCRSLHGTTVGYQKVHNGKILPIFANNSSSENDKVIMQNIRMIQKGIINYANRYVRMIRLTGIDPKVVKEFVVRNYDNIISFPDVKWIDAIGKMSNSDDFGCDRNRNIIEKITISSWLSPKKMIKTFLDTPWREASLKRTTIPTLTEAYFIAKRLICWKRIAHNYKSHKENYVIPPKN